MPATKDTQIGAELPPQITRAKNVQARTDRSFEKNIHDDAAAQGLGFKRGFVAGGQSLGWISKALTDFFGPTYYETGRYNATFVAPVFDDEDVTVKGVVTERAEEDGGVRITVGFWLEKPDGSKAVNGQASAVVK
jgi:acyl dehydratase